MDMRETELERFVINNFDAIGVAIIVIFGAAMFVSIFFNNTGLAILSTILMFGGGSLNVFLMDGPARRANRAFEKMEQTWDDEAAVQ